jgi:hypothetical protein
MYLMHGIIVLNDGATIDNRATVDNSATARVSPTNKTIIEDIRTIVA